MMLADLIDQDDFRDRLTALGIALSEEQSPDECAALAAAWFKEADAAGQQALLALVAELTAEKGVVLPEVSEAIQNHLADLA